MKKFVLSLLAVMFFAVQVQAGNFYDSAVKLTVQTKDNKDVGAATGVAIDNETILTAGHFCVAVITGVATDKFSPDVKMTSVNVNKELVTVGGGFIWKVKSDVDLCLIKLTKHGIKPIKFATKELKIEDTVVVIGAPHFYFPAKTVGSVISPRTEGSPLPYLNNRIAFTAAVNPGNSGGPILNTRGELVGLTVAVHILYHHISWGVPLKEIREFIAN